MDSFRKFIRGVLVSLLALEARAVLRKYRPRIIAVTGSVGKTSTKDAIYSVISRHLHTRKSEKSFNSEIGIPLTILGAANAWRDFLRWLRVLAEGLGLILLPNHYPKWLVLEVGADRPGDISAIARWMRTEVVVITRFPDVPVHVEFFKTPDAVAAEKQHLVKSLFPEGTLILNADDEAVLGSAALFRGSVVTYGMSEAAHVRGSHESILYEDGEPVGMGFRIEYRGNSVPCELRGALGQSHISAALAAAATGIAVGINLVNIAQDIGRQVTPPGRMRLLPGRNSSTLIDDTYNSSPIAAEVALQTLKEIKIGRGRKIAILGDMMELGPHSVSAHEELGRRAAKIVDVLCVIGVRARDVGRAAIAAGFLPENVVEFPSWREAIEKIPSKIEPNDIVLIKGSQSPRLEKVTAALLAPDMDPKEVLVRQEEEWLKR